MRVRFTYTLLGRNGEIGFNELPVRKEKENATVLDIHLQRLLGFAVPDMLQHVRKVNGDGKANPHK